MPRQVAETRVRSGAPPGAVWELLSNSATWASWGPWHEVTLEREGEPPPEGVGAIRRFRPERRVLGREVVTREEITAWEPPRAYSYRLLEGLPLRKYESRVELAADGGGTEIHWRSEFDPAIPLTGRLTARRVTAALADIASRVARAAEQRSGFEAPTGG